MVGSTKKVYRSKIYLQIIVGLQFKKMFSDQKKCRDLSDFGSAKDGYIQKMFADKKKFTDQNTLKDWKVFGTTKYV